MVGVCEHVSSVLVSYLETASCFTLQASLLPNTALQFDLLASIIMLLAVVSPARLFMSLPLVFPLTTAPVTESGDTMLGLAVHKGHLDIIKYLITECSVSVNSEQSVYVSTAICV